MRYSFVVVAATLALLAGSAAHADFDGCEHGEQYTVRSQVITSVEKSGGEWVAQIDPLADKGCGIGDITAKDLPKSCVVGKRITASGTVFLDYSTGLYDVHDISCD